MADASLIPSPPIAPGTETFFDAANRGVLVIKRCNDCKEAHYYPRQNCPYCFSANTAWIEAKGTGTIYSCSFMRRAKEPYMMAYVELAEGPRMLTNIVDCDLETVRIGMAVRLVFKDSENGQKIPMFTPA